MLRRSEACPLPEFDPLSEEEIQSLLNHTLPGTKPYSFLKELEAWRRHVCHWSDKKTWKNYLKRKLNLSIFKTRSFTACTKKKNHGSRLTPIFYISEKDLRIWIFSRYYSQLVMLKMNIEKNIDIQESLFADVKYQGNFVSKTTMILLSSRACKSKNRGFKIH